MVAWWKMCFTPRLLCRVLIPPLLDFFGDFFGLLSDMAGWSGDVERGQVMWLGVAGCVDRGRVM